MFIAARQQSCIAKRFLVGSGSLNADLLDAVWLLPISQLGGRFTSSALRAPPREEEMRLLAFLRSKNHVLRLAEVAAKQSEVGNSPSWLTGKTT